MTTKKEAKRIAWIKSRAMLDVYEANQTLELVIKRFFDGNMDEISYMQAIQICKNLYVPACRDLNWDPRWERNVKEKLEKNGTTNARQVDS